MKSVFFVQNLDAEELKVFEKSIKFADTGWSILTIRSSRESISGITRANW